MTGNREYLDCAAAWSSLDDATRAAIGDVALKIAVCRSRRKYADPGGRDAHAAGVAENLLYDLLHDIAREALPDLVTSDARIRLLSLPGLVRRTRDCSGCDPRGEDRTPRGGAEPELSPACAKCTDHTGAPIGEELP